MAQKDKGFGSMDRVRQKEIASLGGKAAHAKGTAHQWTSDEAKEAGRRGGIASAARKKAKVEITREADHAYAEHTGCTIVKLPSGLGLIVARSHVRAYPAPRCEHRQLLYCDADGCTYWPVVVCKAVAPTPTLFGK